MKFKEIMENLKIDKKSIIVICVGITGIVLLLISNFSAEENIDSNVSTQVETSTSVTFYEIEQALEEKLRKVISSVKGVGNADVMVSVGSTGEFIYAENVESDSDNDSSSSDTQIVIYEQDDNEYGLVANIKSPEIIGVAVICEGGESSIIKAEITDMITSLFGIGADRVYVGAKS